MPTEAEWERAARGGSVGTAFRGSTLRRLITVGPITKQ